MLSHTIVPSTARLDHLVAAVVLGDPSPFDIREKNTTLLVYADATGLKDVQTEMISMGKKGKDIQSALGASLKPPKIPKATALLCTSGHIETGPGEVAILKPLVDLKEMEAKALQTWKRGQAVREETEIGLGLNIIGPDLCYLWPYGVPFIALHADINSS